MTGDNVTITSKDNVYHSDEKHEYKKSGLTVSASGGVADILTDTIDYAKKASSARDKQLKALYGAEVYETMAKGKDSLNHISEKGMPGIKVGIGSSAFKATSHTETTEAVGSNLVAKGELQITAKKDMGMKGSTAVADHISMKAGENIHITAAENRSTSDIQESSKSSQAGVGFMPTGNTFYANSSKGNGNETEETVTHTESQVIANKNLTMESGKDTTLKGSQIQGDTVTMKVRNHLTIESLQDQDDYHAKNESKGIGFEVGTSRATHKNGAFSVGTTKGQTNSTYESVTDQAGIRAGQGGYDITVKGNTHLKGGLIGSDAAKDKNTLTTGTLTWEDIDNKADYSSQNKGQNLTASWSPKVTDEHNNTTGGHKIGINPVQSQPVKGKADSATKSAISEGTIHITDKDHQNQNVATLPRDTKNSLNKLEKIFDKDTIRERQELATEFAKLGAEKIGDIAKEKGWDKNDTRRTLLHGLLGGITAKLGGNNVLSGAMAGAGMESLQPLLDNFLKDHPDMREEVSSIFGYCAGKLLGGDGETGSAVAWNGTKFNWLNHEQMAEYAKEWDAATTEEEKKQVKAKWLEINDEQEDNWLKEQGVGDYWDLRGIKGLYVVENPYVVPGSTFDWKSSIATAIIGEEAGLPWALSEKYGSNGLVKALGKYNAVGIGISGTLDFASDYKDYSGGNLFKAMLIDTTKTGIGMGIGLWNPYLGFISAPFLDKFATDLKEASLIKDEEMRGDKNK